MEKTHSNTRTLQYLNCFKFVYFSGREKRKLMTSINGSQSEVNQEIEAVVALEPRKNDFNVSQNSNESTLPKSISREDAHYSSDPLLADNFVNPDKVLNETANQRQEDRKQHSTDEETNIKNYGGNQFGEKVVDSGKHCSVISPNNVLRVLYAEILKQPIRKPQSCGSSDSQDIAECDLTQGESLFWRLSNHWVILLNMKNYVLGIDLQVPLYQIKFLMNCLLKRYLN